MMRFGVLATVIALCAGPGFAQSDEKATYCGYQGDIVAAIAQAKLDRIAETKANAHVAGAATWPAKYNAAIPLYVGEIYKLKRRDLKNNDLGAQWKAACLAN